MGVALLIAKWITLKFGKSEYIKITFEDQMQLLNQEILSLGPINPLSECDLDMCNTPIPSTCFARGVKTLKS